MCNRTLLFEDTKHPREFQEEGQALAFLLRVQFSMRSLSCEHCNASPLRVSRRKLFHHSYKDITGSAKRLTNRPEIAILFEE